MLSTTARSNSSSLAHADGVREECSIFKGQAINGVASTPHYDDLGRIDSVTNALGLFNYNYDGVSSRLGSIDLPNGQQTTFGYYDNLGDRALSNITHLTSGGGIISKFDYGYSARGRISDWTQQHGTQPATGYKLGYDDVDQLRDATVRDVSTQAVVKRYVYDYDSAGNRTSEQIDNQVTTEKPNQLNQLVQRTGGGKLKVTGALTEPAAVTVNGVAGRVKTNNEFEGSATASTGSDQFEVIATDGNGNSTTQRYQVNVPAVAAMTESYDLNGNLIQSTVSAGPSTTYEWDAANRCVAINSGAHRTELSYDGQNRETRRVERENGTVIDTRQFIWCGWERCEERDGSNAVSKRFYPQGEQINRNAYFYSRDHLGSVRELSDAAGAARARYDYDVWGLRSGNLITSNAVGADFGFTGHYVNTQYPELAFAPLRIYNTSLGRWLSRDPIEENGDINLYGYVHNDPLNLVDPLGLKDILVAIAYRLLTNAQLQEFNRVEHDTLTQSENREENNFFAVNVLQAVDDFRKNHPLAPGDTLDVRLIFSREDLFDSKCKKYDDIVLVAHGNTRGTVQRVALGYDRVPVSELPANCGSPLGCKIRHPAGFGDVLNDMLKRLRVDFRK
ncbi:MAG: hypothetical protein QOH88_3125 [Verrucomicrobiota bacterium]|jgi:RHS repeat-associated protein